MASSEVAPILTRIANSVVSYLIYIEKMIYPSKLGILYPYIFVAADMEDCCCLVLDYIHVYIGNY